MNMQVEGLVCGRDGQVRPVLIGDDPRSGRLSVLSASPKCPNPRGQMLAEGAEVC